MTVERSSDNRNVLLSVSDLSTEPLYFPLRDQVEVVWVPLVRVWGRNAVRVWDGVAVRVWGGAAVRVWGFVAVRVGP